MPLEEEPVPLELPLLLPEDDEEPERDEPEEEDERDGDRERGRLAGGAAPFTAALSEELFSVAFFAGGTGERRLLALRRESVSDSDELTLRERPRDPTAISLRPFKMRTRNGKYTALKV